MNILSCQTTENGKLSDDFNKNIIDSIKPEDITVTGDMGYRAMLNFNRLENEEYRPDREQLY